MYPNKPSVAWLPILRKPHNPRPPYSFTKWLLSLALASLVLALHSNPPCVLVDACSFLLLRPETLSCRRP
ncbi:hypothetical protein V8C43DRAFT_287163 [Trichoderma afarasin]